MIAHLENQVIWKWGKVVKASTYFEKKECSQPIFSFCFYLYITYFTLSLSEWNIHKHSKYILVINNEAERSPWSSSLCYFELTMLWNNYASHRLHITPNQWNGYHNQWKHLRRGFVGNTWTVLLSWYDDDSLTWYISFLFSPNTIMIAY